MNRNQRRARINKPKHAPEKPPCPVHDRLATWAQFTLPYAFNSLLGSNDDESQAKVLAAAANGTSLRDDKLTYDVSLSFCEELSRSEALRTYILTTFPAMIHNLASTITLAEDIAKAVR
jgi:hypothetical protein